MSVRTTVPDTAKTNEQLLQEQLEVLNGIRRAVRPFPSEEHVARGCGGLFVLLALLAAWIASMFVTSWFYFDIAPASTPTPHSSKAKEKQP